jgi:hypothetical protein
LSLCLCLCLIRCLDGVTGLQTRIDGLRAHGADRGDCMQLSYGSKTRLSAKSSEAADWREGAHGPPALSSRLLQCVTAHSTSTFTSMFPISSASFLLLSEQASLSFIRDASIACCLFAWEEDYHGRVDPLPYSSIMQLMCWTRASTSCLHPPFNARSVEFA